MPSATKAASYTPTHVKPEPVTTPSNIVAPTFAVLLAPLKMLFVVPEALLFRMVGSEEEL